MTSNFIIKSGITKPVVTSEIMSSCAPADEDENEGPRLNISKLVLVNNVTSHDWKRSTPLKTYSKKTPNANNTGAVSRYGRSHKPRIADDFLSTDKKVSQYLKIDADNQLHYFKSSPYAVYKSPNSKSVMNVSSGVSHSQQFPPRKRGRPPKLRSYSDSGLGSFSAAKTKRSDLDANVQGLLNVDGNPLGQTMKTLRHPGADLNVPIPTSTETLPIPPELMDQVILVSSDNEEENLADVIDNLGPTDPLSLSPLGTTVEIGPDGEPKWMVGDLAWACVGGFPYWPCTVTRDPYENAFTKLKFVGKNRLARDLLHVRFFGDHGRRSWIYKGNVLPFMGLDAFLVLAEQKCSSKMKKKFPKLYRAFTVSISVRKTWQAAVSEAESLKESPRSERVKYFVDAFPQPNVTSTPITSPASSIENSPSKSTSNSTTSPSKKRISKSLQFLSGDKHIITSYSKKRKSESAISNEPTKKYKEDGRTEPEDDSSNRNINQETEIKVEIESQNKKEEGKIKPKKNVFTYKTISTKQPELMVSLTKLQLKKETGSPQKRGRGRPRKYPKVEVKPVVLTPPPAAASTMSPVNVHTWSGDKKKIMKRSSTGVTNKKVTNGDISKNNNGEKNGGSRQSLGLEQSVNVAKDRKKYNKVGQGFASFCEKHFDQVADEDPSLSSDEVNKYLEKMWSQLSDAVKARYRSKTQDDNDIDNGQSDTETDSRPSPPRNANTGTKSGKRGASLFSGVKAEKMCSVCLKGSEIGEVVKCKGSCCNYYHLECSSLPRYQLKSRFLSTPVSAKKKRKRGRTKSIVKQTGKVDTNDESVAATEINSSNNKKTVSVPADNSSKADAATKSKPSVQCSTKNVDLDSNSKLKTANSGTEILDSLSLTKGNTVDKKVKKNVSEGNEIENVNEKNDKVAGDADGKLVENEDLYNKSNDSSVIIIEESNSTGKSDKESHLNHKDDDCNGNLSIKEKVIEKAEDVKEIKGGTENKMDQDSIGEQNITKEVIEKLHCCKQSESKEVSSPKKEVEVGKMDSDNSVVTIKSENNASSVISSVFNEKNVEKDSDESLEQSVDVIPKEEDNSNSNESDEKITLQDLKPDGKRESSSDDKQSIDSDKSNDKQSVDSDKSLTTKQGWMCSVCAEGKDGPCFICGTDTDELIRCNTSHCGKVYHMKCVASWPQKQIGQTAKGKLALNCPQHSCHTCISDNPAAQTARFTNDKLVRCVACPSSYHYGNYCIPAGTELLSTTQMICPRHYVPLKESLIHVNASWCSICAVGGSLICCDTCPNSFHAECLKIDPPEGSFICEDCETGRIPLYGEVVWVKLGSYRWWPAKILYPLEVPENIRVMNHSPVGEFVVEFFGSHDYFWINRGRAFFYHEGDGANILCKSRVDELFITGMNEASEAFRQYQEERESREANCRPTMKPPKFVKIQTNKPYGTPKLAESDVASMTACECDPEKENPCGRISDCINRLLMVECNPQICPAGDKCNNQNFEKRLYPPLTPFKTETRGWGLKTLVPLKKGDFVIEYVGEMIDEEEYKKRVIRKQKNKDENYYFLTIDKDRMLDAGPKGNMARFMNHSCNPNCETQKWTVNGDTRVGLFTLVDIPAGSELVFNYNLETIGSTRVDCKCGAPSCGGYIGAKVSKPEEKKAPVTANNKKKKPKKSINGNVSSVNNKNISTKVTENTCFTCGDGGELLLCDHGSCPKAYHLECLGLTKHPPGNWECPRHVCSLCSNTKVQRCAHCINSYCDKHAEGNITQHRTHGLVCFSCTPSESGSDWSAEPSEDEETIKKTVGTTQLAGNKNSNGNNSKNNNKLVTSRRGRPLIPNGNLH